MQPLQIFAGKTAKQTIIENGFKPDLFSAFLGASGGPKWFVLAGLDKVIFNDFLDKSDQHIDIIGSSAGSFRAACFAQKNPGLAIDKLATGYSTIVYSDKPDVKEITNKGVDLLNHILDETGMEELLHNTIKSVHIVAARCHGLVKSEKKLIQGIGLMLAAIRNYRDRHKLAKSFTRVILSSGKNVIDFEEVNPIETEFGWLTKENIHQALMASGSIPMIIKGVKNIPGLAPGMFRDGGIIDYHF